IDMMRQYAETGQCRGRALLAYFGEHADRHCGHCDNCSAGFSGTAAASATRKPVTAESGAHPFPVSSMVRHSEWGQGTVMSYERDRMVVLFDEVGYKTLSVPIVRKGGILSAA